MPNQEREKLSKELSFKLTEQEFADRGRAVAKAREEIRSLQREFDEVKKSFKSEIAKKEVEEANLLKAIRDGEEIRRVDCEMVKDYDKSQVDYVFEGKIIESRPMELSERQMTVDEVNPTNLVPLRGKDAAYKDND